MYALGSAAACSGRGVELRKQDQGPRPEVDTNGEGVDCVEDEGTRGNKEDTAVSWGMGSRIVAAVWAVLVAVDIGYGGCRNA